jgi:hypothetical protein
VFVPAKYSQPSFIFAGEARSSTLQTSLTKLRMGGPIL